MGLFKCPYCENGTKIPDALREKRENSIKRPMLAMASSNNCNTLTKRNMSKDVVESDEEDDPLVLAEIDRIKRGRMGFSQQQCMRIKYRHNLQDAQKIGVPYNSKLDTLPQSTAESDGGDQKTDGAPKMMFGPRTLTCPCCEMNVNEGDSYLFVKCCRSVFHENCIGVWFMCQRFCPNKKCGTIIDIN